MKKEQIQSVFDRCGLGKLGDKLSFKLWIKGFGENCDEESLENFLIAYDFDDEESILVDQFLFHYQIYQKVLVNQEIPFLYL